MITISLKEDYIFIKIIYQSTVKMKFVSLGYRETTFMILRSLGLSDNSYPFNWSYLDIGTLYYLLLTNFSELYDPDSFKYRRLVDTPMKGDGTLVEGKDRFFSVSVRHSSKFLSDVGLAFPLMKMIPDDAVYQKLKLSIDNFRALFSGSEGVVFVHITPFHPHEIDISQLSLISAHFDSRRNFTFVIFALRTAPASNTLDDPPQIVKKTTKKDLTIVEIQLSKNVIDTGLLFEQGQQEIDLIKGYLSERFRRYLPPTK